MSKRDKGRRTRTTTTETVPVYANNPELEKHVLSMLTISDSGAMEQAISAEVSETTFYVPAHKLIWLACNKLTSEGKPLAVMLIHAELLERGELEAVGGEAGLMDVLAVATTTADLQHYLAKLKEIEQRRRVQKLARKLTDNAFNADIPLENLTEQMDDFMASTATHDKGIQRAAELTKVACSELDKMIAAGTHITGYRSGFDRLDELAGGFQGGCVYVLGARTNMGKTALSLCFMVNMALHNQKPINCLFLSTEMRAVELQKRIISMETRMDFKKKACTKIFSSDEIERIKKVRTQMSKAPYGIMETNGRNIDTLMHIVRNEYRKGRIQVLLIDYLQLIDGTTAKAQNSNVDKVEEVSRKLHMLAQELNIPIIALAQLNREAYGKKRPTMADLRNCGAIEQDADVVMLLDRPEKYLSDDATADKRAELAGKAVLYVDKNRSGETGEVKLHFAAECTLFTEED